MFNAPQFGTTVSGPRRPGEVTNALRALGRELWSDRVSFIGFLILLVLVLTAVFAPLVAPFDPTAQSLRARLLPPFWLPRGTVAHLLGTDYLGRDVLSRLIYGSRASLGIGVSVVALAGSFGVVMGLVAGYVGGRTDSVIMRTIDTQIAFPGLLLALIILATIGPTPATVIVVLALNGWMVYARMTRGIVLSLRQMPFVDAAEMIGCRPRRVIFRHLLPNLTSPLLTLMMLEFARVVLAEASLSFLGLGVQPPASSWGLDVATGKAYIFNAWWLATFPGFAIALTVLAINLVASWARVTSDPQEREKRFARQLRALIGTNAAPTAARDRISSRSAISSFTSTRAEALCRRCAASLSTSDRERSSASWGRPVQARASPRRQSWGSSTCRVRSAAEIFSGKGVHCSDRKANHMPARSRARKPQSSSRTR